MTFGLTSHQLLWRALTDQGNSYRQRMRPDDIIVQSMSEIAQSVNEPHNRASTGLSDLLAKLIGRIGRK